MGVRRRGDGRGNEREGGRERVVQGLVSAHAFTEMVTQAHHWGIRPKQIDIMIDGFNLELQTDRTANRNQGNTLLSSIAEGRRTSSEAATKKDQVRDKKDRVLVKFQTGVLGKH